MTLFFFQWRDYTCLVLWLPIPLAKMDISAQKPVNEESEKKDVAMNDTSKLELNAKYEHEANVSVEMLSLTNENPVTLSLFIKEIVDSPSFDLF